MSESICQWGKKNLLFCVSWNKKTSLNMFKMFWFNPFVCFRFALIHFQFFWLTLSWLPRWKWLISNSLRNFIQENTLTFTYFYFIWYQSHFFIRKGAIIKKKELSTCHLLVTHFCWSCVKPALHVALGLYLIEKSCCLSVYFSWLLSACLVWWCE